MTGLVNEETKFTIQDPLFCCHFLNVATIKTVCEGCGAFMLMVCIICYGNLSPTTIQGNGIGHLPLFDKAYENTKICPSFQGLDFCELRALWQRLSMAVHNQLINYDYHKC